MELLARVRSQLRRYTQLGAKKVEEQANVYTVGPIVLDEEKKSVTVDGDEVALTPIEFNILRLLMKNPGRIYSSAQIYELVWKEDSLGGGDVGERAHPPPAAKIGDQPLRAALPEGRVGAGV